MREVFLPEALVSLPVGHDASHSLLVNKVNPPYTSVSFVIGLVASPRTRAVKGVTPSDLNRAGRFTGGNVTAPASRM